MRVHALLGVDDIGGIFKDACGEGVISALAGAEPISLLQIFYFFLVSDTPQSGVIAYQLEIIVVFCEEIRFKFWRLELFDEGGGEIVSLIVLVHEHLAAYFLQQVFHGDKLFF